MKYYYISEDIKIETTKEMYDSYIQYNVELENQIDQGMNTNFDFSDFAMFHHFELPEVIELSGEVYSVKEV